MKVRVYPLSELYDPNYYFEYYFEPVYTNDGDLSGYNYANPYFGNVGWYGYEIFRRDLKDGIVKIIQDIKPKQELKKLSFV